MSERLKKWAFLLLAIPAALVLAGAETSAVPAVDPNSYPAMTEEEMGQLLWMTKIADQDLDDFTNMRALDQLGMTSYRYCIAFMSYFMAIEQYHKLPACPGIIAPRMDRLIRKMQVKDVWDFWAGVSRGLPQLEPGFNKPYPEERDPVKYRNIMYSGHVGHMVSLYESLYHDWKYDEPGSIAFVWDEKEKYLYDHHSLNKVMHDQMKNLPAHCVECEPNACFPECNQHPILSFMLHDRLHGTNQMEASEPFMDFFLENKMIHPVTHETANLYLVKQDLTLSTETPRYDNPMDLVIAPAVSLGILSLDSSSANGWTGVFMHAWQPGYIERHYPYMRENHLKDEKDDSARLAMTVWEPQLKYGFFAMLAAEVGDFETRDKLIGFADKKYDPVWEEKALHYPFNLAKSSTALTGKLIASARALPKDGLLAMHQRPFDAEHFNEPVVTGVDYPEVMLSRAVYDRDKKALVVTAVPWTGSGETSFQIERLDEGASYILIIDGEKEREVSGQSEISVEVGLDSAHDVVLIKI